MDSTVTFNSISPGVGVALAFTGALAISAYQYFKLRSFIKKTTAENESKPTIDVETLKGILDEVIGAIKPFARAVELAVDLDGNTEEEKEKIKASSRAHVQHELTAIQKNALASRNIKESDLNIAFAYYTKGPGRNSQVLSKVADIKKATGKYLVTKDEVLSVMFSTFEVQGQVLVKIVEEALAAGRIGRSPQALQMLFSSDATNRRLRSEVEENSINLIGMTVEEVDTLTKTPEYAGDKDFMSKMSQIAQHGEQVLGEAQQKCLALVGGGGGFGF